MSLSLDNAFGIHAHALTLRAQRAEVLASNLANADTPGYKARDFDFREALARAAGEVVDGQRLALKTTHAGHLSGGSGRGGLDLMYREPFQAAIDGNTVEAHIEQAKFLENAIQYQASFEFLNRRISSLKSALTGQ